MALVILLATAQPQESHQGIKLTQSRQRNHSGTDTGQTDLINHQHCLRKGFDPKGVMWTLRRNIYAKKDPLWLTGPKFKIRIQQPLLQRSLTHVAYQGKPQTELPCLLFVFLPPELNLIKEFWESYVDQRAETFPIQPEVPVISLYASVLTNQSIYLHNNQSV